MIIWGINAMNHDASISVVNSETCEILFAAHSERYSRLKNDQWLNEHIMADAYRFGEPDLIVWYENPWGRRLRYLKSGQYRRLFADPSPRKYLRGLGLDAPIKYVNHHESHAAGGFYTSGFSDAAVLVVDAIGEISTASIWHASEKGLKLKWTLKYPHSLGLFYSAVTDLVGLKPNEEEYILMGMAAYGKARPGLTDYLLSTYFEEDGLRQKFNFHRGLRHDGVLIEILAQPRGKYNLAASAQEIVQRGVKNLAAMARAEVGSTNLVYSGGVALNCVANGAVAEGFEHTWIMPNPGDAGSSLGAIAAHLRKPLKWRGPFLGHSIDRELRVDDIVKVLSTEGLVGVASGPAEFGPRAFGNRSLLADPRRADMKDKVNSIKKRQQFRPFAPAVLAEHAHEYFELSGGTLKEAHYMQYVARVKGDSLPAITHFDNTARVQVVGKEAPVLRAILEKWYAETGCPVLLNTSLNVKGEPLVNTAEDADRWARTYGVKVM